ncbi:hypothetical protein [Streptomyces sp. CB01580]|uniref:hypothetical protein n=1 Tax=Streptomyces sp. CB01580 TaxID=1703933 RepID=UPI001F5B5A2D|nr:hypothetical protein [Streptomyces sp. CB01580]
MRRTADCWDEVRRVLLTREQTIEYELPSAEGKHAPVRSPAKKNNAAPWPPS